MKRSLLLSLSIIFCSVPSILAEVDPLRMENFQVKPIPCIENLPGNFVAVVAGGVPPYTFLFDDVEIQPVVPPNIFEVVNIDKPGDHSVEITDSTQTTTALINFGPSSFDIIDNKIELTCDGLADFTYDVKNVIGELESVRLTSPNGFYDTKTGAMNSFTNVPAGRYTVTYIPTVPPSNPATCSNPISLQFDIPLFRPFEIISIETTAQNCPDGGTITISLQGGKPPFIYKVQFDEIDRMEESEETTFTFAELPQGNYDVTILDSSGPPCIDTAQAVVNLFENESTNYSALNAKYCNIQPPEETS